MMRSATRAKSGGAGPSSTWQRIRGCWKSSWRENFDGGERWKRRRPRAPRGLAMKPVSQIPPEAARNLIGVFTDIDDTLTTDGRLPAAAYAALERLSDAG